MASPAVTYLLWFFFGWAGLHHLYLHRLNQAFVWFATFGGFGLGWVRDFWKIPDYIKWCNGDQMEQARHLLRCMNPPRAGCSWSRFLGMVVMGFISATVLSTAVLKCTEELLEKNPKTYNLYKFSYLALLVLGNGLGILLVANIGELQCNKYYPFASSAVVIPCVMCSKYPILLLASFATVLVVWYKGLKWRPLVQVESPPPRRKRLCRNVFRHWGACSVWLTLLGVSIYFNASIPTENENIPVRVLVNNFFKSPAWINTKKSVYRVYRTYWPASFSRAWRNAKGLFKLLGEINPFTMLDLPRAATQEEIEKICRKLSEENHPDLVESEDERSAAYIQFIKIQQACYSLLLINTKTYKNSKMSEDL